MDKKVLAEILKKSFDPYFNTSVKVWATFANYCEPILFEKDEVIKKIVQKNIFTSFFWY